MQAPKVNYAVAVFTSELTGEMKTVVLKAEGNLQAVTLLEDVNIIEDKEVDIHPKYKLVGGRWVRLGEWIAIEGWTVQDAIAKVALIGIQGILEKAKSKIVKPNIGNINLDKLKPGSS